MFFSRPSFFVAMAISISFLTQLTLAQEYSAKVVMKDVPVSVASEIKNALDTNQVIEVSDSEGPVYDFWFRKALPINDRPLDGETNLKVIESLTLLGVAEVCKSTRDFRNDAVDKGVYTMRFELQPENGNHFGTTPFPYFAVLVPTKYDQTIEGIKTEDRLNDLSRKDTSADHPGVLALQPLDKKVENGEFPTVTKTGEWTIVALSVPARVATSNEDVPIKFGLVIAGHGKI